MRRRHAPGRLQLEPMPLAVVDRERMDRRKPSAAAIAATVAESNPPDKRTTADFGMLRKLLLSQGVRHIFRRNLMKVDRSEPKNEPDPA